MAGVKEIRLNRLIDERATVSKLDDDLLAAVESREADQSLNEIESGQHEGYKARAQELDQEILSLTEDLEREAASARAQKLARAHLAGDTEGIEVDGEHVIYRTFAAYARDYILGRMQGGIADQIRGSLGGAKVQNEARERIGRMLARTPANTLTSDIAGLTPAQHISQIFQVIETSRPLVASAIQADLERGTLTYPQVDATPVVAVQGTEKTEAGNTGMDISMVTRTASTYLGGGDLSWQAINWSTPSALDLWFRFAAADYALKTEQDAAQVMQHSAFSNNIATTIGGTPTFADFMTAVGAGYAEVFANSGRIADTVYLAPDRFGYLLGLTSSALAQFVDVGQAGIGPLRVVVSRGMDAGVIVVGDAQGLIAAETPGAPVELRAVEPAIGGLEVGIIGAFEAAVVDDGAFAMISTAS
jgi:hypothetical protein